ncbi:MAG TPA: hypothetical protein DCX06_10480 [Opitutae bacterium]|nr:hypothetical protein [Opitutae bacterium]
MPQKYIDEANQFQWDSIRRFASTDNLPGIYHDDYDIGVEHGYINCGLSKSFPAKATAEVNEAFFYELKSGAKDPSKPLSTTQARVDWHLWDLSTGEGRRTWRVEARDSLRNNGREILFIDGVLKAVSYWNELIPVLGRRGDSRQDDYREIVKNGTFAPLPRVFGANTLLIGNCWRYNQPEFGFDNLEDYFHGTWAEFLEPLQSVDRQKYSDHIGNLINASKVVIKYNEENPSNPRIRFFEFMPWDHRPLGTSKMKSLADSKGKAFPRNLTGLSFLSASERIQFMDESIRYKVGLFLLCADEYSFFGFSGVRKPDSFGVDWPENIYHYEHELLEYDYGAPVAAPRYLAASNRWYRKFENAEVIFDMNNLLMIIRDTNRNNIYGSRTN